LTTDTPETLALGTGGNGYALREDLKHFGLVNDDTVWEVLGVANDGYVVVPLYVDKEGKEVFRHVPRDGVLLQSSWITIPNGSEAKRVLSRTYPNRFIWSTPNVSFRLFEVVSEHDLKFLSRKKKHRELQEKELTSFLRPENLSSMKSRDVFSCDTLEDCQEKLITVKSFLARYPGILRRLKNVQNKERK
jgi:hypothetical protein